MAIFLLDTDILSLYQRNHPQLLATVVVSWNRFAMVPITEPALRRFDLLAKFPELQRVDLTAAHVSAEGLGHLKGLKKLRELNLCSASLAKSQIEALRPLTSLEVLNLSNGADVSGSCLETFQEFKKLRVLKLNAWKIDDDQVKTLVKMKSLRELDLNGVYTLSDKGLAELSKLPNLEILRVQATQLSDVGIKSIAQLPNLKELLFTDHYVPEIYPGGVRAKRASGVTNKGLKYLATCKKLDKLSMENTKITADGILQLKNLPALREIQIDDVYIKPKDLTELQKAMPRVKFVQNRRF